MPRPRGNPDHQLTVGDLFCGAGGFSEGFRQAGFRVLWGVDAWKPAVDTFAKNHPGARAIKSDVHSMRPQELPQVDVLIGSPPCVHFSGANRGGNGDRKAGLRLVRRFLTYVRQLQPKYWVMENVPGLQRDLEMEMRDGAISLNSGSLNIPNLLVFDASNFGAPQIRKRLFSGDFPIPPVTHGQGRIGKIPLRHVLETLPDPAGGPTSPISTVPDPVYEGHSVLTENLRDHFEDARWRLSQDDLRLAEERKLRDRIYGVMSFPDDVDRPSRTITATRTHGSRMTIVVPYKRQLRRTLTLRECASVQGFPLSYQFWAGTFGSKDVLVGNAVSPPVSFQIAQSIRRHEGMSPVPSPRIVAPSTLPRPITVHSRTQKRFSPKRRFRGVVSADWRRDHRIELENECLVSMSESSGPTFTTRWNTHLYLGYARLYNRYRIELLTAIELAEALVDAEGREVTERDLASLILPIISQCSNGFPDGNSLQRRWSRSSSSGPSPYTVCRWVNDAVKKVFPDRDWKGIAVPRAFTEGILAPHIDYHGKGAGSGQPVDMSIRLVASALSLAVYCQRLNEGAGSMDSLMAEITEGGRWLARSRARIGGRMSQSTSLTLGSQPLLSRSGGRSSGLSSGGGDWAAARVARRT